MIFFAMKVAGLKIIPFRIKVIKSMYRIFWCGGKIVGSNRHTNLVFYYPTLGKP